MLFRSNDSLWEQEIRGEKEVVFSWHGGDGKVWLNNKLIFDGNRSLTPGIDCFVVKDRFVLRCEGAYEVFCSTLEERDVWQGDANVVLDVVSDFSQMDVDHDRRLDLCSPTSVCNAVNIYFGRVVLEPKSFAELVFDAGANIFGNWSFAVAAAFLECGAKMCVVRMKNFSEIVNSLVEKKPVVVSIKGPIIGGASEYTQGHLVTIYGFADRKVYCIDSAFIENTRVTYPYDDFVKAWEKNRNTAYRFI